MNQPPAWKPTLLWHAKFLGAILAACTAVYVLMLYAVNQLPGSYSKHRPAPEATPWLNERR